MKFCHHKTQKLGKSPNFGVISEIQRAKFGVFVTYTFGGKIWGSNENFRGKFWGQAPDHLIWKYPPGVFVSLGIAKISEILKLLLIFKFAFSKPFWNNLNNASTANIREVMKFYNVGNKSFETD